MSYSVHKRGKVHRVVVKETGRVARNRYGTPHDGGGHNTKRNAMIQAAILNRVKRKK